ncbi:hypothetical protein LX15_002901 [Streptoalloteichus tenebrarius]|uniref:Uncharacterized protein n=1 Tax=Streptoalloteichus tenebrarius (strain ATCC 17920 / DSM 40477 / JCM 4838 / CBS 697.72 / NBRC 16177 / NCIMB 11028 / NRRL B-12390 / A12253. 1 / ISP 5477) TaxID=1933 RepID=A0ABT1HUK3_STRSD|nr:hypothetical protein [Streptoalloteichus tenebrarius]MCP2259200.1 hypothetical protein [Streptoalloteichus tenebrarius]BFF04319.1 hypothetical protein GCM10020241_59940 [Streptoalloteichus tenebrarius]
MTTPPSMQGRADEDDEEPLEPPELLEGRLEMDGRPELDGRAEWEDRAVVEDRRAAEPSDEVRCPVDPPEVVASPSWPSCRAESVTPSSGTSWPPADSCLTDPSD